MGLVYYSHTTLFLSVSSDDIAHSLAGSVFFLVSLFHSPIPHSFVIFFKFSRWIGFHLHQIYVFFFSLTILFSIKVFFYVEKNARTRNFYPQVKIEIKKNACITCIDFSVSLNFHLIHLLQGGNHARFVKAKYRQRETASKREKKRKKKPLFCVCRHTDWNTGRKFYENFIIISLVWMILSPFWYEQIFWWR